MNAWRVEHEVGSHSHLVGTPSGAVLAQTGCHPRKAIP
jgi:hypothetical protein